MTGIILQARMGSMRLPGKILKRIGSKTLLGHIVYRLTFLKHKIPLVIATSSQPGDDAVEVFCKKNQIRCFRGSERNVLERYYLCAKTCGFQAIIRLTGDNPFPDIEELDRLIDLFDASGVDYAQSHRTLPAGVGAEIFSFRALEKSYQEGTEPHQQEHADEYILEHPELFKSAQLSVPAEKNHPEVRLTVDTEADYKKACYIVEHAESEFITTPEALKLCLAFA